MKRFTSLGEAMMHAVCGTDLVAEKMRGDLACIGPLNQAMLAVWYSKDATRVTESVARLADHISPQIKDAERGWIIDGILFAAGLRRMMTTIPAIAEDAVAGKPINQRAFAALQLTGRVLNERVAVAAWEEIRRVLREKGWV